MQLRYWMVLIPLFLVGCETTEKPTAVPLGTLVDQQHQWLSNLLPGQPIDAVLEQVLTYQEYSFETLEDGQTYQYVQGKYPGTNLLFGVYFENSVLAGLILDQQVTDFSRCRLTNTNNALHWLVSGGIKPYSAWIVQQNQLGNISNTRVAHRPNSENESNNFTSPSDMVEAASYLPVIAVALPFYVLDRMSGGFQMDKNRSNERIYLSQAVNSIELGSTMDELIRLLGSPDERQQSGDAVIWDYRLPGISIGIIDQSVRWKETAFSGTPRNSTTIFDKLDCGSMFD